MSSSQITKQVLDEIAMDLDISVCPLVDEGMDKDVIKAMLVELVKRVDCSPTSPEDGPHTS